MARRGGYAGLAKLRKTLQRLPKEVTRGVKREIDNAAQEVHFEMLVSAPKYRGILAEHIKYKISGDGLTAKVGFMGKRSARQAFYARFIEYGTVDMAAQPFVFPALEKTRDIILRDINSEISKAIKRA